VKFVANPHNDCLKLKMPGPQGIITVASSTAGAYLCEQQGMALVAADVATANFAQIQCPLKEEPPTQH
jgi:hypothetical protein